MGAGTSEAHDEETDEQEEARLELLRARIESIRADKERLEQNQIGPNEGGEENGDFGCCAEEVVAEMIRIQRTTTSSVD
jgi:hypothetical protein